MTEKEALWDKMITLSFLQLPDSVRRSLAHDLEEMSVYLSFLQVFEEETMQEEEAPFSSLRPDEIIKKDPIEEGDIEKDLKEKMNRENEGAQEGIFLPFAGQGREEDD